MNKKYLSAVIGLAAIASLAAAMPALAEDSIGVGAQVHIDVQGKDDNSDASSTDHRGTGGSAIMKPAIFGVVSAVSGNTIMVSGRNFFRSTTTATTTFTIDATNAKITKNDSDATTSVSNISVGDTVMIQGTISGTNVVATMIHDGAMMGRITGGEDDQGKSKGKASSTPPFVGNGQPIVVGMVSSIASSTISITNKSNVSYTINATNAKILAGNDISSLANISVGDTVLVQGTINGTSITASTIIDQSVKVDNAATSSDREDKGKGKSLPHGFLGRFGSFFAHLFGF
jgi:hypothetical protein